MSTKNNKIEYGNVEISDDEFLSKNVKTRITMMIDQDVLDHYKSLAQKNGDKYQSLINRILKENMNQESIEERLSKLEEAFYKLKTS